MFFLYLDESGKPTNPDNSNVFTVGGISFHENSWAKTNERYLSIKKSFFPNLKKYEEIKANTLLKPSQADNRLYGRFVYAVLDMALKHHPAIFCCSVYKDEFIKDYKDRHGRIISPEKTYAICCNRLLRTFNQFLTEENEDRKTKEHGFILTDSREKHSTDLRLAKRVNWSLDIERRKVDKFYILESLFFGISDLYPCLQLADFICFIVRANLTHVNYPHDKHPSCPNYSHIRKYWKMIIPYMKANIILPDPQKTR